MKYTRDRTPLAERLAARSKVQPNGCITWTGPPHDGRGYCRIHIGRRMVYVHIAAWELVNGPVPPGLVLRHSCDNPPCLNVAHLVAGTQAENVADMFARRPPDRSGERNNSARLNWPAVQEMRRRREAGALLRELSAEFGVSESQVSNVVNHRMWKETA